MKKSALIVYFLLFLLILVPFPAAAQTVYIEAPLEQCYKCGSFFRTDLSQNWGYYNGKKTLVCPFCGMKQIEYFDWLEMAEEKQQAERLAKAPPIETLEKVNLVYNNKPLSLNPQAVLINERCYIPVDAFTRAIGGSIVNPGSIIIGDVTIKYGLWSKNATFTYNTKREYDGYTDYVKHDQYKIYDCESVNTSGFDYIPISMVLDAIGATPKWDGVTRTVTIDTITPQPKVSNPEKERMAIEAVAAKEGITILSEEEKRSIAEIDPSHVQYLEKRAKQLSIVDIAVPSNVLNPPGSVIVKRDYVLSPNHYYLYFVVQGDKVVDQWCVEVND